MTPTIEAQDHTTSPYASAPLVSPQFSSLTGKPALQSLARLTLPRPPLPAPRLAAIMTRPFGGTGWGKYRWDFYSVKQKYFTERDWTGQIALIWLKKLVSARTGFSVAKTGHDALQSLLRQMRLTLRPSVGTSDHFSKAANDQPTTIPSNSKATGGMMVKSQACKA